MDEDARIRAVLEHIRSGGGLENFPATRNEKRALIATAGRRRLIAWEKTHRRYEITLRGRRLLRRRPGSTSRLRLSPQAIAIAAGAMALGLWFSADASRLLIGPQPTAVASLPVVAAAPVAVAVVPNPLPDPFPEHVDEPEEQSVPAAIPPKEPTHAVAPTHTEEPKPVAKSKRKVAKAHRKGTYASRHRRGNPTLAYTDPRQARPQTYFGYGYGHSNFGGQSTYGGQGSYGGRGGWSFFR
jgi:hypothetical protein